MKPNIYQIRVKITAGPMMKSIYMKGVVISKSEAKAKDNVISIVNEWAEKEGYHNAKIEIAESKKLRSDFIIQVKN